MKIAHTSRTWAASRDLTRVIPTPGQIRPSRHGFPGLRNTRTDLKASAESCATITSSTVLTDSLQKLKLSADNKQVSSLLSITGLVKDLDRKTSIRSTARSVTRYRFK